MTARRAKKGGEVGVNGERYSGGQFLPSTQLPKQGPAPKGVGTRRQLVEPGVWAEVPVGQRAIFVTVRDLVIQNEDGAISPLHPEGHHCWLAYGYDRVASACDAYNRGERFFNINEG